MSKIIMSLLIKKKIEILLLIYGKVCLQIEYFVLNSFNAQWEM